MPDSKRVYLTNEEHKKEERKKELEAKLRENITLDRLNWEYFWNLFDLWSDPIRKKASRLRIYDPVWLDKADVNKTVYPTAIAEPQLLKELPVVDYESLLAPSRSYSQQAQRAHLWIKKMQAGTGTSITRTSYLAKKLGIPEGNVKIGAKGTDLFTEYKGEAVSLAEAQILQAICDAENGLYAKIHLHEILSPETKNSITKVWEKQVPGRARGQTYKDLVDSSPRLSRSGETLQAFLPTIAADGTLDFEHLAPGGHGLFALDALRAALIDSIRPETSGQPLIASLGNGEDLGSSPDPAIVGWMIQEKIPIAMVTTEKTLNDLKGGQIAIVSDNSSHFVMLIEQAQAKEAGQLELFEKLGLRPSDQMAFFNTNLALFNYDVLIPKLKKLQGDVGESEWFRIISPDLIENRKGPITQLEGAIGSSLLNLDRYWRSTFGEPLVHFINVKKNFRTRFFSPVKSAFDYFMLFHSDRFSFDSNTARLVNHRAGELPQVSFADQYYNDVQNVLDSFKAASIRDLNFLRIEGQVDLPGLRLCGEVTIRNLAGQKIDLASRLRAEGLPDVLRDVEVIIHPGGSLQLTLCKPSG